MINKADIYTAILAGKNFEILLIITIKFDLKLYQYVSDFLGEKYLKPHFGNVSW